MDPNWVGMLSAFFIVNLIQAVDFSVNKVRVGYYASLIIAALSGTVLVRVFYAAL